MEKQRSKWYYPDEIANDLNAIDLPESLKGETLACAFEYARFVIPTFSNWNRYVAFMRIVVMGIIAEFRGSMVDIAADNKILGYNVDDVLVQLFEGTPYRHQMVREYKTFLLITSEKTSERRNGEVFRRYVNALASTPENWFRMRDCDAIARFTIASALACNDLDEMYFDNKQLDLLAEIGCTMYDSVAFYKHRAEGETNNTFAYVPENMRVEAFRVAREVLWSLDVTLAREPAGMIATNFVRFFGGPLHMMMRRYRFVEEGLSIGKTEDEDVVQQTRRNFKLWNRVDPMDGSREDKSRYEALLARREEFMFEGLADILRSHGDGKACSKCDYRTSYGANAILRFGGVQLCEDCRRI